MQTIRGIDGVPSDFQCCLTMGAFDGIHLGHRRLIARLVEVARKRNLPSALLTFDPHPEQVLRPESAPALLTTLEEKIQLLAATGLDALIIAPFTAELAQLSPEEFALRVLGDRLHARALVIGPHLTFGRNGAGHAQTMAELGKLLGFTVEITPSVEIGSRIASSTAIRRLLLTGQVREANELLGRPYRLAGTVVTGVGRGRQLGFPTANISLTPGKLIPADGIYAVRADFDHKRYHAAAFIGRPLTFDDVGRVIEVHLLRAQVELVGRLLAVDFVEYLRPNRAFANAEELSRQISLDCERVQALLAALQAKGDVVESP